MQELNRFLQSSAFWIQNPMPHRLTSQENRVRLIALVVLGALSIAYCLYSCYHFKAKVANPTLDGKPRMIPTPEKKELGVLPPLSDDQLNTIFNRLALRASLIAFKNYTIQSCFYSNVLCPVETHVKVKGETETDYLHANFVKLNETSFIATQFPLNPQLFWQASMDENIGLIVNVSANSYDISSQNKEITFSNLSVHYKGMTKVTSFPKETPLHEYEIKAGERSHSVLHLEYRSWVDFGGLEIEELNRLVDHVLNYQDQNKKLVCIHCRAGIGRTGTLIVACVLKRMIEQGKITGDNLLQSLENLILEGRKQRGPGFVQSEGQFITLWRWATWLLTNKITA